MSPTTITNILFNQLAGIMVARSLKMDLTVDKRKNRMINLVNINIWLFLVVCLLSGCDRTSTLSSNDTVRIDYTLKQGEPLPPDEWHCYNIDDDRICIPSVWGYIEQNSFLFISDLSHVAPGSYFGVVKQNKKTTGLNTVKYLGNLYMDVKKDTASSFIDAKSIKVTYTDKELFKSEFDITHDKVPYTIYSTVFEIGDSLYDITIKINTSNKNVYEEIYNNIIFNFYRKNVLVFKLDDKIIDVQIVDLEEFL